MELKEEMQKYSSILKESSEYNMEIIKNRLDKLYPVMFGGKQLGSVWEDGHGWAAESNKTGNTWDLLDNLNAAIEVICSDLNIGSPSQIVISIK